MRSLEPNRADAERVDPVSEVKRHERKKTAGQCGVMADVRYEIDRLDRILVELIAERQTYIEAAARIKPSRHTVRDEDRIEDVVAKVLAASEAAGLSAAIAEPVWRCLIEKSIEHEFSAFDQVRSFG